MTLAAMTVDLLAEDFHANAHTIYDELRAQSPVSFVRLPHQGDGEGFWMVTGYAAAEAALRHRALANDPRSVLSPEEIARRPETQHAGTQATMLFADPPEHTRLRRVVQKAFTPRFVARLRPTVARHAERLLTSLAGRETVDLVNAYAYPLPLAVIGDMLGYPESWHARLRDFAERAATRSTPLDAPEGDVRAELEGYARDLVEIKRRTPGDDLVSRLLNPESAEDRLSDTELLAMIGLLTAAGFETTASVISCAVLALASHRDQWEALRRDPELAGAAVEETLRYWCPIETAIMRFATEPVELAGSRIGAGDTVLVFPGAANRDPAHVTDPHRFDIHRRTRGHLGFGGGLHTCVGAALARAEAGIALSALVRRWPEMRLAGSEPAWRPGMGLRGLRHLVVRPSRSGGRGASPRPTVLLVPGGFTGAWMWADVVALLRDRGIEAVALDLPTMGPDGDFGADVRAVRDALDRLAAPVLLCGHSYGGGVITEAAAGPHPAVRHLVYLNAAVPDAGDSLVSLMTAAVAAADAGERPDACLVPAGDGLVGLEPEYARRVLFSDCDPARTSAALSRLSAMNPGGCDQPLSGAAWRDLPATYVRGTEDRLVEAVSPAFFAHGPELVELPVGHCPQWSRPDLVADLLVDRARLMADLLSA